MTENDASLLKPIDRSTAIVRAIMGKIIERTKQTAAGLIILWPDRQSREVQCLCSANNGKEIENKYKILLSH